MAIITGPLFSLEAHGSLGDVITYARLGRTNYTKVHFSPANPKSPGQIGIRCMTKFLTQIWSELSDNMQAQFQQLGETWNLKPYHAYLKFNLQRWTGHEMPIVDFVTSHTPTYDDLTLFIDKTGLLHEFTLVIEFEPNTPFSCEVCFGTTPDFTPTRSTAKVIVNHCYGSVPYRTFDGSWTAPSDPWVYYAKARYAHHGGLTSSWEAQL